MYNFSSMSGWHQQSCDQIFYPEGCNVTVKRLCALPEQKDSLCTIVSRYASFLSPICFLCNHPSSDCCSADNTCMSLSYLPWLADLRELGRSTLLPCAACGPSCWTGALLFCHQAQICHLQVCHSLMDRAGEYTAPRTVQAEKVEKKNKIKIYNSCWKFLIPQW